MSSTKRYKWRNGYPIITGSPIEVTIEEAKQQLEEFVKLPEVTESEEIKWYLVMSKDNELALLADSVKHNFEDWKILHTIQL